MVLKGVFVCLIAAAASASFGYTGLYVFGDSLSDTGNDLHTFGTPTAPYYNGRFSNGPIWVDDLASLLGVADPTRWTAGGTNYAYGGAGVTAGTIFIPTIAQQIQYFAGAHTFKSSDLVTLWGGANDFLDAGVTDPQAVVNGIGTDLNTLYGLGARTVIVPNLPNMADLPENLSKSSSQRAGLATLSDEFNSDLATMLIQVQSADSGLRLVGLDASSLFINILGDPAAYGITNTTAELINQPAGTPDTYLFWDGEHPTDRVHQILAGAAYNAVPEPPAFVGLGLGVGLLGLLRRRSLR